MFIHDKHLFPLHLIGSNIGGAYFMDATGNVYSNRTGNLVQLRGSRTNSGTYYKFGQQWGSGWRHDTLVARAKAHKEWAAHTAPKLFANAPQLDVAAGAMEKFVKVPKRDHAETVEIGVKLKGSIIARIHKGKLVFGSDPKIHTTSRSLEDEMLRLAQSHPGVKFVELKCERSVVAGGLSWE